MKILTDKDPSCHLYVVGTSPFEKQIKDYVKDIEIFDNVHFTGSIKDRNLLKGMYTACNLFFFPSLYDNSPLVLREASVMRIPSLLCLGSNASEVIKPDINGFLEVPAAEKMALKINNLFANPDLMKEAGLNASRTIPVTWDEIVDRVIEEYASIIEKHQAKTDIRNAKPQA
jgi:glycosyltransferase involved in cell wall biosynthesis